MNRELKFLVYTKVGFALMCLPWVAALISGGTITVGILLLLLSFAGAAMWGFSYGVLHEME